MEHGHQASNTIDKYRHLCGKHILPLLGERKLRDLKAAEVDRWLASRAESLSTSSLRSLYGCLNRSVRRAMARDFGPAQRRRAGERSHWSSGAAL
jgi:hypothetical protein